MNEQSRGKFLLRKISRRKLITTGLAATAGVSALGAAAGLAAKYGLILPDLPPPEAQRVCDVVRAGGLDTILLVAPTTAPQRPYPEQDRIRSASAVDDSRRQERLRYKIVTDCHITIACCS